VTRELYEECRKLYKDEELAQAVYEDAEAKEHSAKIEGQELQLPHPADARKWLDRKLGRDNETPSEREAHRKIADLEAKIAAMNEGREG
jgi:hypothetical protein